MRWMTFILIVSMPALASKTELEPGKTTEGQVLTCEANGSRKKEHKTGDCRPSEAPPKVTPTKSPRN
jgi:hypothetical protein